MIEIRVILKDGTCAVYENVTGIQADMMGAIIYIDCIRHIIINIKWDNVKAIKAVKK